MSWLAYDETLIDEITARMDLRKPNAAALHVVAEKIEAGDGQELVCDLATGVGKTYLAAGLVDYLAIKGVRNILIVTPGNTVQEKTVSNFTPGHPKFIPGAEFQPIVITADNFSRGQVGDALHDESVVKLFVFNVQQLIKPSVRTSRKVRNTDEYIGSGLYEHLRDAQDLTIIADEHHVYRASATAFAAAIRDLEPRALVGLTATPDSADKEKVVYRYSLADAIADELVKIPVIVYREDGIKDVETQLADACHLRARKELIWHSWAEHNNRSPVSPVLFVVCKSIADADRIAETLTGDAYLPGEGQVLLITSQSTDQALNALAAVEEVDSPVRAVVSVDKLKEGWDVKNIAVIIGFRALASQTLTEQVLGRGLRLPFGRRLGVPAIDHVDLIAHDSYRQLLAHKNALLQQVMPPPGRPSRSRWKPPAQPPLPFGGDPRPDLPSEDPAQPGASDVQEIEDQGTLRIVGPARVVDGESIDGSELLQFSSMDAVTAQHDRDEDATYKVLYKVEGAPTIVFPRREHEVVPVHFSLSTIKNADAQHEGRAFVGEFSVHLSRRALDAERDAFGNVEVRERRVAEEEATQNHLPIPAVRKDLEDRIWELGLVEQTLPELHAAQRITLQFLAGAGVTDETEAAEWSERRAQQAANAVAELIRINYNLRKLQPQYLLRPIEVPVRQPMPSDVGSKWEEFVKRRWYEGWERSIQPVASFDAKTTEWVLANMFEASNHVSWWLRIYEPGPVWIERDNTRKYYPDFIVVDTDGVHWVVEGKSDRDARDIEVLDKRKAGDDWSRLVRDDGRFGVWRYVFATETHIRQAGSWEELLARTRPER